MKRLLIVLTIIFLLPIKVYASGGFNVSPTKVDLHPGESKTITISSNNSVGRLNITSSSTNIASFSKENVFIQTPGASETFTITAKNVGSATVSVVASNNYATMDEEYLTGQTKTIKVNVTAKTTSTSTTKTTTTKNPTTKSTTTKKVPTTKKENNSNEVQKSTNNNLKEIIIDGYNLEKVDSNNYKLIVPNNITNITIKATAEDSKAIISNTGNHLLSIGNNTIELIVTSESGNQNKIYIQVTRKESLDLEDLSIILNDNTIKDINIKIDKNSKLTKQDIDNIISSKKIVNLNYYDENNILKYTWILDGTKIKSNKEFKLEINNTANENITKLSNYAMGIYLSLATNEELLDGTKIKYYVGDYYNENDILNLYYYDSKNNKLKTQQTNIKVKEGYIELELKKGQNYFISMSKIINKKEKESYNYYKIISIGEFVVLLSLIGYNSIKTKTSKNSNNMI